MLVALRFFGKEFTRILRKIVPQETGFPPAIIYDGGVRDTLYIEEARINPSKYNMDIKTQTTGQADALADTQNPNQPAPKWAAVVEDKFVPAPQQRVEVRVLKSQAGVALGEVVVRDLGGEHDVALKDDQIVDLAEGNVFYAVSECDAPKPTSQHAPPKLAFFVDDRPEETLRGEQTGRMVREWFGFTLDVLLFRDYQSPNDKLIGLDDVVRFADGPLFYTRRSQHLTITVKINGKDYVFHQASASVPELKKRAGIPLADVLTKIVNSQMVPLDDNAVVELHCGEVFVSHPRDNASS
jgi:hypothetical protein